MFTSLTNSRRCTGLDSTLALRGALESELSATAAKPVMNSIGEMGKLKLEIARLEGLVKKLQSELVAEREYVRSLEEHLKTVQQH